MKAQIWVTKVLENVPAQFKTLVQGLNTITYLFVPDEKLLVFEYGGELFVTNERPDEKAVLVAEIEVSEDDLVARIYDWYTNQVAVQRFLREDPSLKDYFSALHDQG